MTDKDNIPDYAKLAQRYMDLWQEEYAAILRETGELGHLPLQDLPQPTQELIQQLQNWPQQMLALLEAQKKPQEPEKDES